MTRYVSGMAGQVTTRSSQLTVRQDKRRPGMDQVRMRLGSANDISCEGDKSIQWQKTQGSGQVMSRTVRLRGNASQPPKLSRTSHVMQGDQWQTN